jgi:hypothetical protein
MEFVMLVVNRFIVTAGESEFVQRARTALAVLAVRPGYVSGQLGRAYDDPTHWSLVTEWASVGAYRRALGAYDVKVHATPLLAQSLDEPSAYEVLGTAEPGGAVVTSTSDRAEHPVGPGSAPGTGADPASGGPGSTPVADGPGPVRSSS